MCNKLIGYQNFYSSENFYGNKSIMNFEHAQKSYMTNEISQDQ